MAAKSSKKSGDLLQIVILTLFMVSGMLALSSLVFYMLIPGRREVAEQQIRDIKTLVALFNSSELKNTRDSFEQFRREAGNVDFRDLLSQNLLDLKPTQFPKTIEKTVGKTTAKSQTLKIQNADLQSLLNYVARVRQAHRGVYAGSINLTRRRIGGQDDDGVSDWNADFTFYLYQNEEVLKKFLKKEGPAVPTEAAGQPVSAPTS